MAKVFSIINYKGGVGKSTTAYHVGCSLAEHHDKRVLLIDIDPQTNLTFLCKPELDWRRFQSRNGTIETLWSRFRDQLPLTTSRCIWQSPVGQGQSKISKLDLIPCDIELLGEDLGRGQLVGSFPSVEEVQRQAGAYLRERSFLKRVIAEIEERYDYVLIDCPPNLYLMTQNALAASDAYIVTAIPDHLSTIGLNILIRKIGEIRERIENASKMARPDQGINMTCELGGIVFTKVRSGGQQITNVHESTMTEIRRAFPDKCFETSTTEAIGFSEAAERYLPVWHVDTQNARRATNRQEYPSIATELFKRYRS